VTAWAWTAARGASAVLGVAAAPLLGFAVAYPLLWLVTLPLLGHTGLFAAAAAVTLICLGTLAFGWVVAARRTRSRVVDVAALACALGILAAAAGWLFVMHIGAGLAAVD
jgi:hypothetical protein